MPKCPSSRGLTCSGRSGSREERIADQIDLTDGQVVGGPPPRIEATKVVDVERTGPVAQDVGLRRDGGTALDTTVVRARVAAHVGELRHPKKANAVFWAQETSVGVGRRQLRCTVRACRSSDAVARSP